MATSSDVLHAINVGSNVGDDFACNTYSGRKRPPVNRNGWRPSCSHSTLRAIRYRALLHRWAFCPYLGIAISLWPMIVPRHFTLDQAAASESTQAFLLVGTLVLLPTILFYSSWSYWVFRGKVRGDIGYG